VRRFAVLVVALTALLVSGCAQVAQKAVEQATGVQVDQKGEAFTIKGKDGESVNFSSETPAELKDFPIPQGFKLDSSGSMTSNGDKVSVASYKGKGALDTTVAFYQSKLPGLGWKEEGNFMTDTGGMINYTKGDTDGLTVTVSKDNENLDVSVLLGKSKTGANSKLTATAQAASASSNSTANATPTPASEIKATPKPGATSTPAPPITTSASAIPAELKDLPMPPGFDPIKDGMMRIAEGGKFKAATARFHGNAELKTVGEFFQTSLPAKGWTEDETMDGEDQVVASYTNDTAGLQLVVVAMKDDTGTEINLQLSTTN
jgi:hypothetical protein